MAQKQMYLDELNVKKTQGLLGIKNFNIAIQLATIYQYLMLTDHIAHNHVIHQKKLYIINYERAFIQGGLCQTSEHNIFNDEVYQVNSALNNHFIDILALKNFQDKYFYIDRESSLITPLTAKDTWYDFFQAVKEALIKIKETINEEFINQQFDQYKGYHQLVPYLQTTKNLYKLRHKNLNKTIIYIDLVLTKKQTIFDIDINGSIKTYLDKQKDSDEFLEYLQHEISKNILYLHFEKKNLLIIVMI